MWETTLHIESNHSLVRQTKKQKTMEKQKIGRHHVDSGKRLLMAMAMLLLTAVAAAQSRPAWTVTLPKADNESYVYVCENAVAGLERDARNQALARVFQTTAMRIGVPFEAQKVFEAVQRGTDISVIGREYNMPINKVCEYTERVGSNYRVYVLCQVAKAGNVAPRFDYDFRACYDVRQYNSWVALVKSAIVPGLGQMGKRHYAEGWATLLAEGALVGGAAALYAAGNRQADLLTSGTLNYDAYVEARERYGSLRSANHALWGAAAALYVFNLYRAFAATPRYRQQFAFAPAMMPTRNGQAAWGACITLNF